jgi:hypothetical protein
LRCLEGGRKRGRDGGMEIEEEEEELKGQSETQPTGSPNVKIVLTILIIIRLDYIRYIITKD